MSKKMHLPNLIRKYQSGSPLVMVTAYDYPSASLVDHAGVDLILVGDSLGSVVQGQETTLPVTLDEMVYHAKMVCRAVKHAVVVIDLPFMSYQLGPKEALAAAGRVMKETGADAVKLEGPYTDVIHKIVSAGIPVMGHVGLTPQSYHQMGGHRVQGKTTASAERISSEALEIEKSGAFSVVLEGVPESLGKTITDELSIPTIGIGAGAHCSGQVLVLHDIVGFHAVGEVHRPKFVKQYGDVSEVITAAISQFAAEVREQEFPTAEHAYAAPVLKEVKAQ